MKEYSLVIASNFLDHYMLSLSNELRKYFKDFYFIASEKLEENYKRLGFSDLNDLDFVVKAYNEKKRAADLIYNSDIVITGSYAYQSHLSRRIKDNKTVIFYSERLFKDSNPLGYVLRYIKYNLRHNGDDKSILLCVSAYAAGDYNSLGLFKGRTYKWGYFPDIKEYDVDELLKNKKENSIIWVGRLIKWKHPDYAIKVAKKLKELHYDFSMEIIGTGDMKEELENMILEYDLQNQVVLYDSGMSPENVRKHMEKAEIFLFTSDKGEGWGVVLNESMNSACACVASHSAGSTPFLIKNNENGLVYYNDNFEDLLDKTKYLLDNKEDKERFSKNAYKQIVEEWNFRTSASRLYEYVSKIKNNEEFIPYEDGILSEAKSHN